MSSPRTNLRSCLLAALCACTVVLVNRTAAEEPRGEGRPSVLLVRIEDQTITPVLARFVRRAIREADEQGAECLVIQLDTPGGLVDSTRTIVNEILRSRTPVVVYVAPTGARAASAGVFVTLSAHVAAMAPTTTIGAAHPVQVGGLPVSPDREDKDDAEGKEGRRTPMEDKIVNSTVAWARGLAELRGRNAHWAEQAVEESITATDDEALDEEVIDLVATDLDELLERIDGREVMLPQGTVTVDTADAEIRTFEMWWGDRLLAAISNPNIAFLLLIFGFYAVLFELYSPGLGVPGILGIVLLLLGFLALSVLPINYVGLALILLAFGLFVAEIFVTSYGLLAVAGTGSLILGALMLVDSPQGFTRVSLVVILPIAAATAVITAFLVGSAVRVHRRRTQVGGEALVGAAATALEGFSAEGDRYTGPVRVHGEIWKGVSRTPVEAGQTLRVQRREGLTLFVEPQPPNGEARMTNDE